MMKHRCVLLFFSICLWLPAYSQSGKKIKDLESQRGQLQEQIKQSESLLLSTKKDVKSQLDDLALINSQIAERRRFIETIEKDVRTLDGEIVSLEKQMKKLQSELKDKQRKYESSVCYMRKNRTIEEKLMFIFSAQTLNQAYRRLRYVNEYATYQRAQGEQVKQKQEQITAKKNELLLVKGEKTKLLAQREEERAKMEEQEKQQRVLVEDLQKKQRGLQNEIAKKQQESKRLNAQIDRLIEQEIAAARKRAEEEERKRKAAEAARKAKSAASGTGSKTATSAKSSESSVKTDAATSVAMMEEYKGNRQLSGNFEQNRGKLPMPITGSYAVVSHFGQYAVSGLKNVKLDNKGIDIKGQRGAQAHSIFGGEVSAVFQYNGMVGVLVRHGNYISVYCNLASASVKKGDKVNIRDVIGTVATDASGNTILHFQLRKETVKLDPERWIGR